MNKVTKTFSITTTPDVMQRLENFLCFLHFNGGHSGLFAMPFDGDGSDKFKCDPPPTKLNYDHQLISDAGHELEVAYDNSFKAFALDRNRVVYSAQFGRLYKKLPGGESSLVKDINKNEQDNEYD